MRRLVLPSFIAVALAVAGCQKVAASESAAAIKARIDSSVKAQLPLLRKKAAEDLDKRSAIEVKAKADSIVHAIMYPKKADTTHKAPIDINRQNQQVRQKMHFMDSTRRQQNPLR